MFWFKVSLSFIFVILSSFFLHVCQFSGCTNSSEQLRCCAALSLVASTESFYQSNRKHNPKFSTTEDQTFTMKSTSNSELFLKCDSDAATQVRPNIWTAAENFQQEHRNRTDEFLLSGSAFWIKDKIVCKSKLIWLDLVTNWLTLPNF